jgi:hypothetical protein
MYKDTEEYKLIWKTLTTFCMWILLFVFHSSKGIFSRDCNHSFGCNFYSLGYGDAKVWSGFEGFMYGVFSSASSAVMLMLRLTVARKNVHKRLASNHPTQFMGPASANPNRMSID